MHNNKPKPLLGMLETTNHSTLRAPCSWAPGFSKIDFGESMNSCHEKPLAGHAAKELKPNPCHPWDLTILMGKLVYSTNLPYSYICSTILSCMAAPRKIRNLFPYSLACGPVVAWPVLLSHGWSEQSSLLGSSACGWPKFPVTIFRQGSKYKSSTTPSPKIIMHYILLP